MSILYLLLIVFFTMDMFSLVPGAHIQGVFNVSDVGNALIGIGLIIMLLRSKNLAILKNPISLLILIYFLIISVQLALSMFYYKQKLLDGAIAARDQFYYASFFLFLLLLNDSSKIIKFLNSLSLISIFLIVLAVINYFGPTIFYHKYAEGHGVRSGITRAFVPAMQLISFVTLWEFCKWFNNKMDKKLGITAGFLLGAHFLRQTRGRIIPLFFIMFSLLFLKGKFKHATLAIVIGGIAVGIAQITMKQNVLISSFESSIEEVSEGEGTWDARLMQISADIEQFMKHPIMGSGLSVMRLAPDMMGERDVQAFKMVGGGGRVDVGFTGWLQFYGIVGLIWLVFFFSTVWFLGRKALHQAVGDQQTIVLFGLSYMSFVMLSFITLNHLMHPSGIIFVCLGVTTIVQVLWQHQYVAMKE